VRQTGRKGEQMEKGEEKGERVNGRKEEG